MTRSSGNYAQAFAYAGSLLGIPTQIVMAENASPYKVQRTRDYGAEVIIWGTDFIQGDQKVAELTESEGRVISSSYDHPAVICGHGVLGLEMMDQLPTLGTFFGPVSGGGLLSGVSTALKASSPAVRVVGVEPVEADDFAQSLRRGERLSIHSANTIADGLRVLQVGIHNWPLLKRNVDDVALVSDNDIRQAMALIRERTGWMIEPSGAASVAALLKSDVKTLQGDVVCILSGGNIDPKVFEEEVNQLTNF